MNEVIRTDRERFGDIRSDVRVDRKQWWFSPGRVVGFLIGSVLVGFGAVAVLRAGIDGSLNVPLTDVFGITLSASTGLFLLGAGMLMFAGCAAEDLRGLIGFVGALGLLAGVLGLASSAGLRADVGFAADTAWFFIVWGAVALVASLLPSVLHTRRTVDHAQEVRA